MKCSAEMPNAVSESWGLGQGLRRRAWGVRAGGVLLRRCSGGDARGSGGGPVGVRQVSGGSLGAFRGVSGGSTAREGQARGGSGGCRPHD
jgi:hypothetical protein